jgi:dihydrofolate reductase
LFGRRTYELLAGYWPNASDDQREIARPLNELPKYVASTTLSDPLDWDNARVLQGNVPDAVAALKAEGGGDLHIGDSSRLTQTLVRHGLCGRLPADDHAAGHRRR